MSPDHDLINQQGLYALWVTCANCGNGQEVRIPEGIPMIRFKPFSEIKNNHFVGGNLSLYVTKTQDGEVIDFQELTCENCKCPQLQ